jgi:hypothetical protein
VTAATLLSFPIMIGLVVAAFAARSLTRAAAIVGGLALALALTLRLVTGSFPFGFGS